MTEHRTATDQALNLFVYAPLGLLSETAARLPDLAQRGRVQVGNAKVMGQFAVQMGRKEAESRLGRVAGDAQNLLASWGLAPPAVPEQPPTPTRATRKAASAAASAGAAGERAATEAVPAAEALAIPDYDSLAASQVVARLAGLKPAELEDVRRYEAAHRARKTILGRVAQLRP